MSKPNYTGIYHMVSQDKFEEYLAALGKQEYLLLFSDSLCNLMLVLTLMFLLRLSSNLCEHEDDVSPFNLG